MPRLACRARPQPRDVGAEPSCFALAQALSREAGLRPIGAMSQETAFLLQRASSTTRSAPPAGGASPSVRPDSRPDWSLGTDYAVNAAIVAARSIRESTLLPVVTGSHRHPRSRYGPSALLSPTGIPHGIRTRVAAVKGRCPRPLDERDVAQPLVAAAAGSVKRAPLGARSSDRCVAATSM